MGTGPCKFQSWNWIGIGYTTQYSVAKVNSKILLLVLNVFIEGTTFVFPVDNWKTLRLRISGD